LQRNGTASEQADFRAPLGQSESPWTTSYTVSYNGGKSADTYQIKDSAGGPPVPLASLNAEGPSQARYAYGSKDTFTIT
jgi:hypothetical protein